MKRMLSWILVVACLLLFLASCAGEGEMQRESLTETDAVTDPATEVDGTEEQSGETESSFETETEPASERQTEIDSETQIESERETESEIQIESESESETETETVSDTATEESTEAEDPAPITGLLLSTVSQMQIVFDADGGDGYLKCAEQIRTALKEKCGINLRAYPDAFYEATEYEIVLGSCEGRSYAEEAAALRVDDYFCRFDGKKIVLGAAGEAGLSAVTEWFVTEIIGAYTENENGILCKEDVLFVSHTGTYAVDDMTLGGVDISEYIIIYPQTHSKILERYAKALSLQIELMSGYSLPVYQEHKNHSAQHEIHLGPTKELAAFYETAFLPADEDGYSICKVGDHVAVAAKSYNAARSGAEAFLALFTEADVTDKAFHLSMDAPMDGIGCHEPLCVMSYNVYYSNVTAERADHVVEMIKKYDPDLLGLQEVTPTWKNLLIERLGEEYAFLGDGRDGNGVGEHSAIMYRKELFELIESKTLWLSATPNKVSKFDESTLNRVMTYAILERKSDGQRLLHVNTHLEHKSSDARELQTDVLLKQISLLPALPTFVTGDFNSTSKSEVYSKMENGGFLNPMDSAQEVYRAATNHEGTSVIDYCFIRGETMLSLVYRVDRFKYDADGEGKDPSDHSPVIVEAWIDVDPA